LTAVSHEKPTTACGIVTIRMSPFMSKYYYKNEYMAKCLLA
jgi:hypothetical protein